MKNQELEKLLGRHQELLEIIVKAFNVYANIHTRQAFYSTEETVNLSQIQVIETILGGKDNNMKQLAAVLGITKGTLTVNVKRLEERNLVRRYKLPENRKEVYVEVTATGERLYSQYLKHVYEKLFKKVYEKFDAMSKKDLKLLKETFALTVDFLEAVEPEKN